MKRRDVGCEEMNGLNILIIYRVSVSDKLDGWVENRLQATSYKDQWRAAADCYSTGELCHSA